MNSFTIIKQSLLRVFKSPMEYLKSILLLQLIQFAIIIPVLSFLFYQILSITKLEGLTNQNITVLLRHPTAIFLVLLLGLVAIFFIYYELGFYFVLAYFQQNETSYTLRDIFKKINQKAKYFLSFHSIFFIFYFILILPLASFGLNASLIDGLKIPDFITDEVMNTPRGAILLGLGLLIVFYISLRFIYSILFFVTEPQLNIWQAAKKSWRFSRGKSFKLVIVVGSIAAIILIVTLIALPLTLLPLFFIENMTNTGLPIIAGITLTVIQGILFLVTGFLQPVIAEAITYIAYPVVVEVRPTAKDAPQKLGLIAWFKQSKWRVFALITFILVVVAGNSLTVYQLVYHPTTKIIAHRGYSAKGVENSLGALIAAADAKADFVELDIQETKDKKFVVYHDYSLNRLTKRKEKVSDLTLAELQQIDITDGTYTEKIPSFEEFIDVAKKHNILLLVELKIHGKESPEMYENFVKILKEKNVAHSYIVQSLEENAIRQVKKIDPEIKTGAIVALNIGNLPETSANFIGLEEFSINGRILEQAKEENKGIFVWTVNKDDLIHKYLRLNVAGLITDKPAEAVEIRDYYNQKLSFLERVSYLIEE